MRVTEMKWMAVAALSVVLAWMAHDSAQAATVAYYRFEEGPADTAATAANSILDTAGSVHGTPGGSPVYRTSVATGVIPQTGQANNFCLQFSGGQSIFFNTTFLLHDVTKDATMEFYLNAPYLHVKSLLWSRSDGSDTNRFNMEFWNGDLYLDYREPGGAAHYVLTAFDYPLGAWAHIAFTRTVNTNGTHTYRSYLDGVQVYSDIIDTPNLPTASGWYLSGRPGENFTGYLDEVRISDSVLTPDKFLNAVPEPAGGSLFALAALGLLRKHRRARKVAPRI